MEGSQARVASPNTSQETSKRVYKARVRPRSGAVWELYVEGGGTVPSELTGAYTSEKKALAAVVLFEATKKSIWENRRPYHKSRINANKDKARNKLVQ